MVLGTQNLQTLKEWFEDTGIKQKFMAKKWGVSQGHLSQVVLRKTPPSAKLAQLISEDTEIPLDNLLFPEEQAAKTA